MSLLDSLHSSLVGDFGYIVTLLIALVVVWIEHGLRDRSAFNDAFDAIKSEAVINQRVAAGILALATRELDGTTLDDDYPRFRITAFDAFQNGGFLLRVNKEFTDRVVEAYFLMSRVDSYSRRREELDFGLASAMVNPSTGKPAGSATRDRIINYESSIVKDLQPKIEAIAAFPKKEALKKEKGRSS
ncbi:MAG: hypothetical protein ABSF83_10425 [Nitrososphaerales archaeon]|jgi:hypothetical protein